MRLLIVTKHPIAHRVVVGLLCLYLAGCATGRDGADKPAPRRSHDKETTGTPEPSVKTKYAMARLLKSQGRSDEQAAILEQIIAQDRTFLPAYSDLAEISTKAGDYDSANAMLAKALEIAPQDPILLNNRGVCLLMKGDYAAALPDFTKASQAAPRNTRYRGNVALALGLLGRTEEATRVYSEILPKADVEHNMAVVASMKAAGAASAVPLLQPQLLTPGSPEQDSASAAP